MIAHAVIIEALMFKAVAVSGAAMHTYSATSQRPATCESSRGGRQPSPTCRKPDVSSAGHTLRLCCSHRSESWKCVSMRGRLRGWPVAGSTRRPTSHSSAPCSASRLASCSCSAGSGLSTRKRATRLRSRCALRITAARRESTARSSSGERDQVGAGQGSGPAAAFDSPRGRTVVRRIAEEGRRALREQCELREIGRSSAEGDAAKTLQRVDLLVAAGREGRTESSGARTGRIMAKEGLARDAGLAYDEAAEVVRQADARATDGDGTRTLAGRLGARVL